MSLVKKIRNITFAGLASIIMSCGDDWSKVPIADAGIDQPKQCIDYCSSQSKNSKYLIFDKSCFDNKTYNQYGECPSGYHIKNNIHQGNLVKLDGSNSHNSQDINSSSEGLSYSWGQISGPNVNLSNP